MIIEKNIKPEFLRTKKFVSNLKKPKKVKVTSFCPKLKMYVINGNKSVSELVKPLKFEHRYVKKKPTREIIVDYINEGKNYKEIAKILNKSEKNIAAYMSQIKIKFPHLLNNN